MTFTDGLLIMLLRILFPNADQQGGCALALSIQMLINIPFRTAPETEERNAVTTPYRRIQIGSYVILIFVLVLGLRLLQLQVIESDKYKRLSEQNRLRILRVPAARGIIFDRNGVALVKNIPYFSVSVMPESRQTVDTAALPSCSG
ncbi:MAG: hypothetical protein MZU95_03950 [Desulfomicrobium escambiense]|nr:hypothetical protein [Desulfomicrobium escambiense]